MPSGPRLDAALARIHAAGTRELQLPASRAMLRQIAAAMPWLPTPAADLALLGQDRERWFASKIICGLTGLGAVPVLTVLATMAGNRAGWTGPPVAYMLLAVALFF